MAYFPELPPSCRVLVAPDSFKGAWSAREAAERLARLLAGRGARVELSPLADGGEGTAAVLGAALGAEERRSRVPGPLNSPVAASWWWLESRRLALVDMAAAAGLALVPREQRDPLRTTTAGVGELLRRATAAGARRLWLGAGGSATVDGGAGMARNLGWHLLGGGEGSLAPLPPGGGALARLERILPPEEPFRLPAVDVLCDVTTPLGEAARVFGPQKGADPPAVERLAAGLDRLVEVGRSAGLEFPTGPSSGAAGGLAAGAVAFLGARMVSGVERVLEVVGFAERLARADVVITGEGRLDATSFDGKVLAGVLEAAGRAGVPVWVVAGEVAMEPAEVRARGVAWVGELPR